MDAACYITRLLTPLQVVLTPPGGVGVPTVFYEFTTDRGMPYEEAVRIYDKEVGPRTGSVKLLVARGPGSPEQPALHCHQPPLLPTCCQSTTRPSRCSPCPPAEGERPRDLHPLRVPPPQRHRQGVRGAGECHRGATVEAAAPLM